MSLLNYIIDNAPKYCYKNMFFTACMGEFSGKFKK